MKLTHKLANDILAAPDARVCKQEEHVKEGFRVELVELADCIVITRIWKDGEEREAFLGVNFESEEDYALHLITK